MRKSVGIVGLGLIGGSMAKAIRRRINHTPIKDIDSVYALDLNLCTLNQAVAEGVIDGNLEGNFSKCRLIMIALPPYALLKWVKDNADKLEGSVFVDLCGVKTAVCDEIRPIAKAHNFTYVGGHPMAGREVAGYKSALESLFDRAYMILTPDADSDPETVKWLEEFYLAIGFRGVSYATPERHDDIIAYTSQLAHIASNAYVKGEMAQQTKGFSAGSFKDLTRVAKLDENMWTELFSSNRRAITEQLRGYISCLGEYLEALEAEDDEKLRSLLRDGRMIKEALIEDDKE